MQSVANATGWPDPAQSMSAKDLVRVATLLIEKFPQFYPMFSEQEFTWERVIERFDAGFAPHLQ